MEKLSRVKTRFEIFERDERAPSFKGRVMFEHQGVPPIRAYFHSSCEMPSNADLVRQKVLLNLNAALALKTGHVMEADYLIAALWKPPRDLTVMDLFVYSDTKDNWPGNPDVRGFVFKGVEYRPDMPLTCGDTLRVLGIEEEYRRTCKSLGDYMASPPAILGLTISETINSG
jgi:hypothetical protein